MKKALICIMTFVFALIFCGAVSAANGSIELVSTDSSGVQGNGSSYAPHNTAHEPYISDDGRYVAFESYAGNLVPGTSVNDTLYVKDMQTGKIISVGTGETPLISGNGQYVAFRTSKKYASADTNGMPDVYVFDITNKIYTIVSVSSSGTPSNNQCWPNCISQDGRYVTFLSAASNLVSSDSNGCNDIFVRDLVNKKTTRVSVSSSGAQANESSYGSTISADGRYIAFESSASNLVSGDTNGCNDVFRRDMINNTTTRISVSSSGAQANDYSYPDDISADGNYVIFESVATNLVSGDTNGCKDIFVRDMINDKTIRASLDSNGNQFFYDSCMATTSGDGRFITFYSGDYPMNTDIYVRDIIDKTTDQITNCEKNRNLLLRSVAPTISADGKYLAFQSYDKLVAGQSNVKPNIFRVELNVDTSTPTVVSTNPTTDASGVSINSPVSITFSENIISGSNYSGIYLKNINSGNNLSVTKTISGNTLTINHTNPLKLYTQYKVYIPAGSVKNTRGSNFEETYTYSFSTSSGSSGDTTPPTVNSTNPTGNATGVLLTTPITITFSEDVVAGANYSGIYLKNLSSGNTLSITKSINGKTLTINHTNPLKTNIQYKVYLPTGAVKDSSGNGLGEFNYSFSTSSGSSGDTTPPTVNSTNPTGNATGVLLTTPITITFSEDVVAGANYSGIYLKNLSSGNTLSITKSINGKTLTINHTNPLKTNIQYKVYLPTGAVKDSSGNGLTVSYTYSFSTLYDSGTFSTYSEQSGGTRNFSYNTYQYSNDIIFVDANVQNPHSNEEKLWSVDFSYKIEKTSSNQIKITFVNPILVGYMGTDTEIDYGTTTLSATQYYQNVLKPGILKYGDVSPIFIDKTLHR